MSSIKDEANLDGRIEEFFLDVIGCCGSEQIENFKQLVKDIANPKF
jgi:hypothetical protein